MSGLILSIYMRHPSPGLEHTFAIGYSSFNAVCGVAALFASSKSVESPRPPQGQWARRPVIERSRRIGKRRAAEH